VPDNLCIAVVSPSLDHQHGTERCIAQQVQRLAREHGFEIHLYCQRVENLEGVEVWGPPTPSAAPGRIFWHKVSDIPGPHLLKFLWWMIANRFHRWLDTRSSRLRFDLVYSPGINCDDAEAIVVHAVFHELVSLSFEDTPSNHFFLYVWPRTIHRQLYYRLLMRLERRIYTREKLLLAAVSVRTAQDLKRHFGRGDVRVIPNGVDLAVFNPTAREARRFQVRLRFAYRDDEFVALLIGNDWNNKGLHTLLNAAAVCVDLPLKLMIVGRDNQGSFRGIVERLGLSSRVRFEDPSADVYASPSLHDSFALPVGEAMACGLAVVTSAEAGISAFLQDGVDSFVLQNPRDHGLLASLLRKLCEDPNLRQSIGEKAARTAHRFRSEENVSETKKFLEAAIRTKTKYPYRDLGASGSWFARKR
jgi:glycosyltransferase involved in cell wall biosynthesis